MKIPNRIPNLCNLCRVEPDDCYDEPMDEYEVERDDYVSDEDYARIENRRDYNEY